MDRGEPRRTFTLIQALRGVAAAWVVLFHIGKGQYVAGVTARLPRSVGFLLFDYGSAGVAVFFVLSGFVIAHSLADRGMDARGFGRFVLRRSLRLDPAYWSAMALTVLAGAVYARAKGASFGFPSVPVVLGHVFYVQELLGLPEINVVFWTLTYEVQFYLVLAAAWWGMTALAARGVAPGAARAAFLVPLGLLALVSAARAGEWAPHGLFVNLWHGFFVGVLAYGAGVRRRSPAALFLLVLLTLAGAASTSAVFGVPCATTALVLFAAARTGRLERALAGRGWQFLGRISYSLYLVHVPVLTIGFGIWGRLAGRGTVADLAGLLLVGSGIVLVAAAFWWAVEEPSHRLSVRFAVARRGVAGT